ncbi:hypothetical protein BU26DRAFT_271374 [Trematosphaeria pertusa]|uniref:Uncharacterized protein n=1 Tax=Trematosphaeria pertusa TaxID=390896 RepID=A0A6A6IJU8_9PLEO|nr:uncharacterized protein BU26DRAFT_271374 [Trematosphaeria pertusa]KAF2250854.1 hypothetical protein BU26DRAFT_271374 [Trematosphaeria pertusa]
MFSGAFLHTISFSLEFLISISFVQLSRCHVRCRRPARYLTVRHLFLSPEANVLLATGNDLQQAACSSAQLYATNICINHPGRDSSLLNAAWFVSSTFPPGTLLPR